MNTRETPPPGEEAMRDTGAEQLEPQPRETAQAPIDPHRPRGFGGLLLGLLLVAVFGVLIFLGMRSRAQHDRQLQQSADATATPVVRVTTPTGSEGSASVTLPANVTAYVDTPIYARTSGYLKHWFYDIGAHVQQGALLAVIETPEVDEQVLQAESDVKTAQANLQLAQITATRWEKLLRKNAVSRQEADQATSDLASRQSTLSAQQANLERLRKMQAFERVYAPFSGVITARNVDTGSLIQAGQNNPQQELFHLAAVSRLRLFVPVPEVDESAVRDGERVPVTLDAFPDRTFYGTLMRSSHAVDPVSRTLNVEVDVDNPTGRLLPGAYAFVHLTLPSELAGLRVPSNTLLFRAQGMQVGVVKDGRVTLHDVTIGHDYGATVEIVEGIKADDRIVLDPSDSLESGDAVRVAGADGPAQPRAAQ